MANELVTAYWDYAKQSWHRDQAVPSYQEWLEARVADLTATLTPFARFGKLQHRYAPDAIFTIAYDRNGTEVVIRYADFIRAAELVPDADAAGQGEQQIGGRGGIAEIMEPAKRQFRVRYVTGDGETNYGRITTSSEEQALRLIRESVRNVQAAEIVPWYDEVTP